MLLLKSFLTVLFLGASLSASAGAISPEDFGLDPSDIPPAYFYVPTIPTEGATKSVKNKELEPMEPTVSICEKNSASYILNYFMYNQDAARDHEPDMISSLNELKHVSVYNPLKEEFPKIETFSKSNLITFLQIKGIKSYYADDIATLYIFEKCAE